MRKLKVDDGSQDGSVIVRDEDALCYIVKATENGVSTVRTISKVLLAEWIEAVRVHPDLTEVQLQGLLAGKSKIDKLEYGYAVTLKTLAEMSLELKPTIHVLRVYSDDFCEWFAANRGKGSDKTAKKYLSYFKTLTDAYQEPTHSYWHGLYNVMYGHDAERDVAEIGKLGEFDRIYGGILTALEEKKIAAGMNAVGAQKAITWFWQPEVKPHTCVTSALNAYQDFLKWRESRIAKTKSASDGDMLTVALDLFKRERLTWTNKFSKGEPVYKSINTDVRDFFGDPQNWDVAGLKADANKFKDFCIQHTWMLQNGKGWTSLSHYSNADRVAFVDWLDEHVVRGIVSLAQTVCEDNGFKGITNKAVTELLMKFHPGQYCLCNAPTLEALHALDLLGMEVPDRYGYDEYQHVMGVCAQLRQRLEDAGIVRVDGESDVPDYLTVNEFLYFVAEQYDLIMQEWSKHMKHEIKLNDQVKSEDFKFKDFVDVFIKAAQDAKLKYDDDLVRRFVCALMAKPFVVLTGLSGSGKTKLADAFTQWIGTDEMVKVVPVGADWTNNEKMLGYPNALDGKKYVLSDTGILKFLLDARDNPSVPFFLVLDEMNLSHVERYFADFLSAMESGKKIHLYDGDARMSNDGVPVPAELEIPKNLFVIGTMNVDETTYMFSPKVLDRAQVIEFRVSPDEMKTFLAAPTYPKMDALKGKGVIYATAFLGLAQKRGEKTVSDADANKDLQDVLNAIFPELAKLGSEFAYRCAIEVVTFVAYYLEASGYGGLTDDGEKKQCRIAAVDAALLQKMLPKLHGSLNRLGPAIDVLLAKFTEPTGEDGDERKQIYPLSCDKLVRMRDRLEANGFTSYAEA